MTLLRSRPGMFMWLNGKTFVCPRCRASVSLDYEGGPHLTSVSVERVFAQAGICRKYGLFRAVVSRLLAAGAVLPLTAVGAAPAAGAALLMAATMRYVFEEALCAGCLSSADAACTLATLGALQAEVRDALAQLDNATKVRSTAMDRAQEVALQRVLTGLTLQDFRAIEPEMFDKTLGNKAYRLRTKRAGIPQLAAAALPVLKPSIDQAMRDAATATSGEGPVAHGPLEECCEELRSLMARLCDWNWVEVDVSQPDEPIPPRENWQLGQALAGQASGGRPFRRPLPTGLRLFRSAASWRDVWEVRINAELLSAGAVRRRGAAVHPAAAEAAVRRALRYLLDSAASAPTRTEPSSSPAHGGAA